MKINSTVFTVIVIVVLFVAIDNYYIGVSNQTVNPNQQATPSDILPITPKQAEAVETAASESQNFKNVLESAQKGEPKTDNQKILTDANQPTYNKHNWPPNATGYIYAEDTGYTWIYAESKPNYQSKMDNQRVLTSADLPVTGKVIQVQQGGYTPTYVSKSPDMNQPWLGAQPVEAPTRAARDVYDDLDLRSQTYEATAYHTLQLRLHNAGFVYKDGKLVDPNAADPVLAQVAYDLYKNDMLRIQSHRDMMLQKFQAVNMDDTANPQQREMIKQMLLNKEQEPIYVPRQDY
jgi:hypothetical protein